ncbi:unnamed protein product [Prunus armeniaca]
MEMYVIEQDGIDHAIELNTQEGASIKQAMSRGDLEKVQIDDNHPDRIVKIGAQLPPQIRDGLTNLLRENGEVFAWSCEGMRGKDLEIISHHQSIDPTFKLVCQKSRAYNVERDAAMKEEVNKLTKIGFIREVNYPSWLANMVMLVDSTGGYELLNFMGCILGVQPYFEVPTRSGAHLVHHRPRSL